MGANDDITLEPQLFNMAQYVSGEVLKITIPDCGHIGLFMKKQALEDYWKPALNFVLGTGTVDVGEWMPSWIAGWQRQLAG